MRKDKGAYPPFFFIKEKEAWKSNIFIIYSNISIAGRYFLWYNAAINNINEGCVK